MQNIDAFTPVIHEKKMLKGFCYIYIYQFVPLGCGHCDPKDCIWI